MHKTIEKSLKIGDKELFLQIGKLAPKADVSVLGRIGDTCILTTIVTGRELDLGYFPLSVEYVEKLYAGGRIKGSRWVKREGRPTDEAVLKGRVIDRSIRPLFPKAYKKEVQIVSTLLSVENENSADMLAALTVSIALHISAIPWNGPISTVRVGYVDVNGEKSYVINPTDEVMNTSHLDLVVSSTPKKVLMIETQAQELADDIVLKGIEIAHAENVKITEQIEALRKEFGAEKEVVADDESNKAIKEVLTKSYAKDIDIIREKKAHDENDADSTLYALADKVAEENPDLNKKNIGSVIESIILDGIKEMVLKKGVRFDGRKFDEIRELTAQIDLLPRTHGSALFQRGMTQVMSITTLGSSTLEQLIESPEGEESKRYIHHYVSPPYSYGQTGRMGYPGRREIGHGALAEKALEPVLPSRDEFPYAIRVVSEVLSSNGSTSMASTCASSLSLMTAGVPLKAPVAGISIGLMYSSDDEYVLLTDIAGIEDFAGHMDFKVAGTEAGITAIQLDVKNDGLTQKMIKETFEMSRTARTQIFGVMAGAIKESRKEISDYAPRVVMLTPPADKIGEIIGPGGKNIKKIIASTGADINIDDDGKVTISAVNRKAVDEATEAVKAVYRELTVGEEFDAEVMKVLPIGAFVQFLPGREGLVHVSKLSNDFVKDPNDVVSVGQKVRVRLDQIDSQGRYNLAMVGVDKK